MSTIESRIYKHMEIRKNNDLGKTSTFSVLDRRGMLLGQIRWWPSWRQYCFFPHSNTVFSKGCLDDVSSFIEELMQERKKK